MRVPITTFVAGLVIAAAPANAQGIPVHDVASYLQTISTVSNTAKIVTQGVEQVRQAKAQVDRLKSTYDSFSKITNVNQVGTRLIDSSVRNILPNTHINAETLLSGDIEKIGSTLGNRARHLQEQYGVSSTSVNSDSAADAAYRDAVRRSTGQAATTAAMGDNLLDVSTQRMQGLEELRRSLDQAKDPKDVMDLNARLSVEQAQLLNDSLKLKAIEMAQSGRDQLRYSSSRAALSRDTTALIAAQKRSDER